MSNDSFLIRNAWSMWYSAYNTGMMASHPLGVGGTREDVDAVDILANLYKRIDYRRPEIRAALSRCRRTILATQNPGGGLPYKRNVRQSHMSIPASVAGKNVSTMFATWFRVHTLGLIEKALSDAPEIRFNQALSMGWHDSACAPEVTVLDRLLEVPFHAKASLKRSALVRRTVYRIASRFEHLSKRLREP